MPAPARGSCCRRQVRRAVSVACMPSRCQSQSPRSHSRGPALQEHLRLQHPAGRPRTLRPTSASRPSRPAAPARCCSCSAAAQVCARRRTAAAATAASSPPPAALPRWVLLLGWSSPSGCICTCGAALPTAAPATAGCGGCGGCGGGSRLAAQGPHTTTSTCGAASWPRGAGTWSGGGRHAPPPPSPPADGCCAALPPAAAAAAATPPHGAAPAGAGAWRAATCCAAVPPVAAVPALPAPPSSSSSSPQSRPKLSSAACSSSVPCSSCAACHVCVRACVQLTGWSTVPVGRRPGPSSKARCHATYRWWRVTL